MKSDLNFNLDDIIEETQNKKKKNNLENKFNDIFKNDEKVSEDTVYFEKVNQSKDVKDINCEQQNVMTNNENFSVNINYAQDDILIDESLIYNEENNKEDDVISNFFKKSKRIKYDYLNTEDLNEQEEEEKLNQQQIFEILKQNKKFLIIKTSTVVLALITSLAVLFSSAFYDFNYGTINLGAILNLISLIIAGISCSDLIINGFKYLVKSKCSFDVLLSMMCITGVVQCTLSVFNSQVNTLTGLYTPSIILALLFRRLAQCKLHKIMKLKSRFISCHSDDILKSVKYAKYKNMLAPDEDNIMCFSEDQEFNNKGKLCYDECDYGLYIKNLYIYLILIFCVLVGAVAFFVSHNVYTVISSLCCFLVIAYPLTKDFGFKYIINRFERKLFKKNILLYKYSAIDKVKDCRDIIIDNNEFFSSENFKLIKMKIFDYNKINDSIIDISSLLLESRSLIAKVFLDIIGNKRSLIKEVSNIEKDVNGITGFVDNKNVIFGTSDYILDNNIVIPSKYINLSSAIVEDKSLKTLYVAIDGYLTAMFLIKVTPFNEIKNSLKLIEKNDFKLAICLKEPFISAEDVSYIYNLNKNVIREITIDEKNEINSCEMGVLHSERADSVITSIVECLKIKQCFDVASMVEFLSFLLTSCLVVTFIFLNVIYSITFTRLLLIQLFWFLVVFLVSNIRR